jgi:hypothetical protein
MAIMETVVSTQLSHPNVVQVRVVSCCCWNLGLARSMHAI